MIPKLTQARPNVLPNYWCGTCGGKLPPPEGPENTGQRRPWHFCPICGECIEYEMAEPVQWKELDCIRCGQPLIRRSALASMPPHYIAAPEYVGTSLCAAAWKNTVCRPTACSVRADSGLTAPTPISSSGVWQDPPVRDAMGKHRSIVHAQPPLIFGVSSPQRGSAHSPTQAVYKTYITNSLIWKRR